MSKTRWQETRLWTALEARPGPSAQSVRATLLLVLNDVETILDKGGTAETDFTLHDADHAFRVAERMVDLMSVTLLGKLSLYELALLLLSAYLHDIGMTPEQRKVRGVFQCIAFGQADLLDPAEQAALQRWLDEQTDAPPEAVRDDEGDEEVDLGEEEDGDTYFASPQTPRANSTARVRASSATLARRASELTTAYARHRHNDWSAAWMRAHLSHHHLDSYHGWLSDLVTLCGSHHQGRDDLLGAAFDPRRIGSQADIVHLRYLAMLLRVADVLDFDPERTPEVILRHRDVRESSRIFWWKDAGISVALGGKRILVSARPASARLHRAILATIEQVEAELRLCRELADEKPLDRARASIEPLPHRWTFHTTVLRDVAPADGAYVYIDGAFRPDVKRVLALLSGTNLYQDPLAAVRELLQNAFDAVREEMAHVRLRQPNPADPAWDKTLGGARRVDLRLEATPEGLQLVCSENGSGMTRRIIERYLLVGAATSRPEIVALERRAKEAGFSTGRTGQFGIGVLSYFMIAHGVRIETRRSTEAGDAEETGWVFESQGLDDFGELRADRNVPPGTKVTLRLRDDVGTPSDLFPRLRRYVRDTVAWTPCHLSLTGPTPGTRVWRRRPGWGSDRYQEAMGRSVSLSFLGAALHLADEPTVLDAVREHLPHWRCEGTFGAGAGRYRVTVRYVAAPDGESLMWLPWMFESSWRTRTCTGLERLGYAPSHALHSWKGMATRTNVNHYDWPLECGQLQVDWLDSDAATIAVHRNELRVTPRGKSAYVDLAAELTTRLADRFVVSGNPFACLSAALLRRPVPDSQWEWLVSRAGDPPSWTWGRVTLPAIEMEGCSPGELATGAGQPVCCALTMQVSPEGELHWSNVMPDPDRVCELLGTGPVLAWTRMPSQPSPQQSQQSIGRSSEPRVPYAEFPPNWIRLAGSAHDTRWWNRANAWTQLAAEQIHTQRRTLDRLLARGRWDEVDSLRTAAALLLRGLASSHQRDGLGWFFEAHALARLARMAASAGLTVPVGVWHAQQTRGGEARPAFLRVLTADGIQEIRDRAAMEEVMPTAPPDWLIAPVDRTGA